jgi:hypothetical protein
MLAEARRVLRDAALTGRSSGRGQFGVAVRLYLILRAARSAAPGGVSKDPQLAVRDPGMKQVCFDRDYRCLSFFIGPAISAAVTQKISYDK